jgi:hypothetical protein
MFTRSTGRRSLAAMAGLTAGVASVVIGPTAVNAQSVEPRDAQLGPDGQAVEPDDLPPAPASHGTCFSWTVSPGFVGSTATQINVPTTARGNNQRHCLLRQGNNTEGVFKLQDAINKCYPAFSSGVGFDGDYGSNTARAVRQIQGFHGLTQDGVYGPDTKTAMNWPAYRRGTNNFFRCVLLRT